MVKAKTIALILSILIVIGSISIITFIPFKAQRIVETTTITVSTTQTIERTVPTRITETSTIVLGQPTVTETVFKTVLKPTTITKIETVTIEKTITATSTLPLPPKPKFNYTIYFAPNSQIEDYLVSLINKANISIYAAFYDLDLIKVSKALLSAKERGVEVKVVTDSDNMDNDAVRELMAAGIVKGDDDPDYMHNKFMIVDEKIVWTGSMNPTFNGINKNNNNVVVLKGSSRLIKDYVDEFKELWNGVFGKGLPVPYPEIKISDDFVIEVYFAPEDHVEEQIIEELSKAKRSIYFATFTFTSKPIANILLKKHLEGVIIKGIYESFQAGRYSTYHVLKDAGIEVIKDKNPAVMHHKFFVIDNKTVITGSFNPTKHANEDNDENILIIHNKDIAELFVLEFEELWIEWYKAVARFSFNSLQ